MKGIYQLFIALMAVIMILAFTCGPYSCEWGNPVYFFTGVLITLVLMIGPFFIPQWPLSKRTGHSLLFVFSAVMVWCGGFILGGFSILCRLF